MNLGVVTPVHREPRMDEDLADTTRGLVSLGELQQLSQRLILSLHDPLIGALEGGMMASL